MKRPAALQVSALAAAAATVGLGLLGCATPPPATVSVAELVQRPAERALVDGLRDYEGGTFDGAERDFRAALAQGLQDRRDAAVAHKYLAFIACAFNRPQDCEGEFRAAFAADPNFRLSDSEIGHPIWGPVYRRVAASMQPAPKPSN